MKWNYLALAIPLFLLFIGWEYYYTRRKGKNFYQYAESVANLNVGIAERLLDLFTTALFFYVFDWVYRHLAIFQFEANWWTWILLFLLTDLVWYWYHRLAHRINLFWAVHVVHHQSEDFNYTVSARITVFQAAVRCLFWSVLPFLGFPPPMIMSLLLVHGLYPFFIHTQSIGKLGPLEWFLVTPSHHRVHHAANAAYLDKNYGDVLIIWDKLFGTYVEEKEQPVFGLTSPLGSHSFLWQHFHFAMEMGMAFYYARGTAQKLRVLFGTPDSIHPGYRSVLERKLLKVKKAGEPGAALRQYITSQTVFSIVLLFFTLLFEAYFSPLQLALLSAFIFLSLINSGAMLDQRRWVFYLEFARLLIVMLSVLVFYPSAATVIFFLILVSLLVYYFKWMERRYLQLIYQEEAHKD